MRRTTAGPLGRREATRILVYEHLSATCSAGDPDSASLLPEGQAMLGAIASDLEQVPGVETLTVLAAGGEAAGPGRRVHRVDGGEDARRKLRELAREVDGVLLIAPESDGLLEALSRDVLAAGGRLLGSSPGAIASTADKLETAALLARAGVPALDVRPCAPGERFQEKVVVKPRDGAGSEGIELLPAGMPVPHRTSDLLVTPFTEGLPASVLFLVGERALALRPSKQTLTDDGRFRYLGGRVPLGGDAGRRAVALASAAIRAVPGLRGFAGVDVILSPANPSADVVVEINPRLTTSYVGLRRLARENIARSWLEIWRSGEATDIEWREVALEFRLAEEIAVEATS